MQSVYEIINDTVQNEKIATNVFVHLLVMNHTFKKVLPAIPGREHVNILNEIVRQVGGHYEEN